MDRWARLEELVDVALRLPAAERGARLEALVPDDVALRAEALALAKASEEAREALPVPEPEAVEGWIAREPAPPSLLGMRLGAFEVLRELGRGGMGVVYEARQDPPGRRVALKVMHTGLLSEAARRRFGREARVLASLRHPAIAQIHAAGTFEVGSGVPLPYFALEYVPDAQPITTYAREQGLTTTRRLRLFHRVVCAIEHGHGRAVIHRDLKPANILVDREGNPKVIDFGIARMAVPEEGATLTRPGTVVGTPAYMSPELLTGDAEAVSVRTDVYALGAVLYELLAGRPAFDLTGTSLVEAARVVCGQRPRPPSAWRPRLSRDLDAIVAKALHADPARRYVSATALREDLERHFDGLPVLARRPSPGYHLRAFVRRHRTGVLAASAVAVALGAATAVSLVAAGEARAQRDRAAREARRASAMLLETQSMTDRAIGDLYRRVAALPGSLGARRALVATVRDTVDALRLEVGDDPRLLRVAGRIHLRLGEVLCDEEGPSLGRPQEAVEHLEKAEGLLAGLVAANRDDADLVADLTEVRWLLVSPLERVGRLPEAAQRLRLAREGLARLRELEPGSGRTERAAASIDEVRAERLAEAGHRDQAAAVLQATLAHVTSLPLPEEAEAAVQRHLRIVRLSSALILHDMYLDRHPRGYALVPQAEASLDWLHEHADVVRYDTSAQQLHYAVGLLYSSDDEREASARHLDLALQHARRRAASDPTDVQALGGVAQILTMLANLHKNTVYWRSGETPYSAEQSRGHADRERWQGWLRKAVAWYEEARACYARMQTLRAGPDLAQDLAYALCTAGLASAYQLAARWPEAKRLEAEAARMAEKLLAASEGSGQARLCCAEVRFVQLRGALWRAEALGPGAAGYREELRAAQAHAVEARRRVHWLVEHGVHTGHARELLQFATSEGLFERLDRLRGQAGLGKR